MTTRKQEQRKPGTKGEKEVITFLVRRDVKRYLEAGKNLFESKRYQEAIEEFHRALELDPNCALVYFNLGYAYYESGDFNAAKQAYQKAVELDPHCPHFLEHLGKIFYETNEFSRSIQCFERATQAGDIQPVSYGILGRAHLERREYRKSISALTRMLELEKNPKLRVYAKFHLCGAYLELRLLLRARELAGEIARDSCANPILLRELADQFMEASCTTMAGLLYKRVIDIGDQSDEKHQRTLERAKEAFSEIERINERIDEILPKVFCGDEELVLQNVHLLMQFGSEKVSRALLSILDVASSPLIREAVIEYSRRYGFPVWGELLPLLSDETAFVREKCAEFLQTVDEPDVTTAMRRALFDSSTKVKLSAAFHLKQFGRFDSMPELSQALKIEWDNKVQEALQEAAASIKQRSLTPTPRRSLRTLEATGTRSLRPMSGSTYDRLRTLLLAGILLMLLLIFLFGQSF